MVQLKKYRGHYWVQLPCLAQASETKLDKEEMLKKEAAALAQVGAAFAKMLQTRGHLGAKFESSKGSMYLG